MQDHQDWDPTIAGQTVRICNNPGLQGKTTGKVRQSGTRLMVQVSFGDNEKSYKPYPLLELCDGPEDIIGLLKKGKFGGIDDLRRILTFEKIQGHLTNIFYSMEVSNTDFYAHQFKPVSKFIESPTGRLLIADEVGLGKTVEAIYVWKELQARANARRLLIVCPAVLREKWQADLRKRFNLFADIVDAKTLLEKLNGAQERNAPPFMAITSLEGLRPPKNWESDRDSSTRAHLARLLDSLPANDDFGLLDLVIIDEAHYLRNPGTANHRLGNLLRDAARHLLLLTATPIQIESDNLYRLLQLISPEDFFNADIFQEMLSANEPVVRALRLTWQHPPDLAGAKAAVGEALKSRYFRDNPVLRQLHQQLAESKSLDATELTRLGYQLENASLLSQYLTRSRKRDVLLNKVQRSPQSLTVTFSPLERQIYDQVSEAIRQQAQGKKGGSLFNLISRQRQMASSIAAALAHWQAEGTTRDFNVDEQLWQDFGQSHGLDDETSANSTNASPLLDLANVDLAQLEQNDSKYRQLINFLQTKVREEVDAKFVIFAYFRGTLKYLERRLQEDGIEACLIIGGQGNDKWDNIRRFESTKVPVLLSSEVGSEGIDLQFCRFLINYDLPWNPMRVEQRIGRLDRLGQKAEKISIINFSVTNTIEEKILERLYNRIEIFRESIGDLENILGAITEKLLLELLQPNLTARQQEQKIEQTATAIEKQRHQQNQLEQEAINFVAFSDHIADSIERDRAQGRWLHPQEIQAFVEDFFAREYPGTLITPTRDINRPLFKIRLSTEAQNDLAFFLRNHRLGTTTQLTRSAIPCFYEPKRLGQLGEDKHRQNELLDPTHPLVIWIKHCYEQKQVVLYPLSASRLHASICRSGLFLYLIHRWSFEGIKRSQCLSYQVINCETGKLWTPARSESFINQLSHDAQPQPNAASQIQDWDAILSAFSRADEALEDEFFKSSEAFQAENENRCNVQERNARDFAQRRRQMLEERLARFRTQGQTQIIPATEGQLAKVERDLSLRLKTIDQRRNVEDRVMQLAAGLVWLSN